MWYVKLKMSFKSKIMKCSNEQYKYDVELLANGKREDEGLIRHLAQASLTTNLLPKNKKRGLTL